MTDHAHHHGHSHGHRHEHGMHGHAAPGEGLLDVLFKNANGLSSLGGKLGGGKDFWLGAAIGAAVVAVVISPEARSALASVFRGRSPAPATGPQNESNAGAHGGD
jgi:hypothetical protein